MIPLPNRFLARLQRGIATPLHEGFLVLSAMGATVFGFDRWTNTRVICRNRDGCSNDQCSEQQRAAHGEES
jgi:hypothetical protein